MKTINALTLALAASTLPLTLPSAGFAQDDWPTRSIRLIVPYAPGGYTDTVARITAQYMEKELGQTVVVENRGGAGGIVGTEATVNSDPDGYTFCVCSIGAVSVAPVANKDVTYNPLTDLAPVSWVSVNPQVVIANPGVPFDDLAGMLAYAKEHPGELNYASSGVGGLMHFSVELFQSMTGTELTHIPYTGGAPATAAVVAGEADITFTNASDAIPQIAEKRVKGIAVTSPERSSFAPDLPAISEQVTGFEALSWNALMAPAGTPEPILEKLSAVAAKMAADPDVQKAMAAIGASTASNTPAEFGKQLQVEVDQWTEILARMNG